MKIIKPITEDEMIQAFLLAEIDSDRWGPKLLLLTKKAGFTRKSIDTPDFTDEKENTFRKELLKEFRGYDRDTYIFQTFPNDVRWYRAVISPDELGQVKYIDETLWNTMTDGTRSPTYLSEKIKSGKMNDDSYVERLLVVADTLSKGNQFIPLILVAKNENERVVVLEGHTRLTSYFLKPEYIPESLEVIIGFSDSISRWENY